MSAETSGTENGIDVDETLRVSSANKTSGLVIAAEQCRRDELRARFEGFEFRVPCEGRVLVTNVSYGEGAKDEHRYVVTVENGVAWECTCPHHQHRSAL